MFKLQKYIKTSYKQPLQIKPFNTKRHTVFALYDENIIQNRFGKKVNKWWNNFDICENCLFNMYGLGFVCIL